MKGGGNKQGVIKVFKIFLKDVYVNFYKRFKTVKNNSYYYNNNTYKGSCSPVYGRQRYVWRLVTTVHAHVVGQVLEVARSPPGRLGDRRAHLAALQPVLQLQYLQGTNTSISSVCQTRTIIIILVYFSFYFEHSFFVPSFASFDFELRMRRVMVSVPMPLERKHWANL